MSTMNMVTSQCARLDGDDDIIDYENENKQVEQLEY